MATETKEIIRHIVCEVDGEPDRYRIQEDPDFVDCVELQWQRDDICIPIPTADAQTICDAIMKCVAETIERNKGNNDE